MLRCQTPKRAGSRKNDDSKNNVWVSDTFALGSDTFAVVYKNTMFKNRIFVIEYLLQ